MTEASSVSAPAADLPRSVVEIERVFLFAVAWAGHESEDVRALAGGTMAAASWVAGWVDDPPWTRRKVRAPRRAVVQAEYLAVLQARAEAPDRIAYANDTGVADLLGWVVDPLKPDPPWWVGLPAAPTDA